MEKAENTKDWSDPIVDEVRAVRDAHARKFDYDLGAIFKDLIRQQEENQGQGWQYVRLPAKRIEKKKTGTRL